VDKRGTNKEKFPLFDGKNRGCVATIFLQFFVHFEIKISQNWKKFLKDL